MDGNFENNLVMGTLIVYLIFNVVNTTLMITSKKRGLKILFAFLSPCALAILAFWANFEILESIVDFDKLSDTTGYGGYGIVLTVFLGFVMMFFYVVNTIIYAYIGNKE